MDGIWVTIVVFALSAIIGLVYASILGEHEKLNRRTSTKSGALGAFCVLVLIFCVLFSLLYAVS